jgi:hypothetical protein
VNIVINFKFHKSQATSSPAEQLFTFSIKTLVHGVALDGNESSS